MAGVRIEYTPPAAMPVRVVAQTGAAEQTVRVVPDFAARVVVSGEFNIGRSGSGFVPTPPADFSSFTAALDQGITGNV